jgi:hypothetical protein
MALVSCDGSKGLPDGFLELPEAVYAGDPQWVPESKEAVRAAFSLENSWFKDGRAQCFVIPGLVRAAAFISPHMVIDGQQSAFFGYFESQNDSEADGLLFDAVCAWAKEEGASRIFGPINFATFGNYRLRVRAEEGARTFQSEPYNPVSYPGILEAQGFSMSQEYLVQMADAQRTLAMTKAAHGLLPALETAGYRFLPLEVSLWLDNMPQLHVLVDQTFALNFAYTPLPYDAFVRACGESFVKKACPHTSVMALGPHGDIAGFCINYPHYGPVITQSAGNERVAVGDLNFETHNPRLQEHRPRVVLVKTIATAPDHRKQGLMNAMATYGILKGQEHYDSFFAAMIRSDNPSRRYTKDAHQAERWYALYAKVLSD